MTRKSLGAIAPLAHSACMTVPNPTRMSLFARRLRQYRTEAGEHGRMTQEQLADLLDLSTEAISKYERSCSFLRGDLEHRFIERLGWTQAQMLECRLDWENRHLQTRLPKYHVTDAEGLIALHNGAAVAASAQCDAMVDSLFPPVPASFTDPNLVWSELFMRAPQQTAYAMTDQQLVGHWALLLLNADDTAAFRARSFVEVGLAPDRLRRALLPGTYFGYIPGLAIRPGHEAAVSYLMTSFIRMLEDLVARDALLDGIGATAITTESETLCRDLGFVCLGQHKNVPHFSIWELPGSAIPGSVFGRRSPTLRLAYAHAFGEAP